MSLIFQTSGVEKEANAIEALNEPLIGSISTNSLVSCISCRSQKGKDM